MTISLTRRLALNTKGGAQRYRNLFEEARKRGHDQIRSAEYVRSRRGPDTIFHAQPE